MSHRIGNNLALLSSSLLSKAMASDDPNVKGTVEEANERILAIATVQSRLCNDVGSDRVDLTDVHDEGRNAVRPRSGCRISRRRVEGERT
ncbi:histidine kinase dimerization/phosphoacceptor domain -containing protein [Jiella avicenniae]|uniref:histidine kinase dimerization/phosphoacceptor domain -containing protein n=1 Tax=Jiella avicenniae TaxID=2907202 RepID=UPI003B8466AE